MQLCANGRYGTADYTEWPQLLWKKRPYLAVIRRKPANAADPRAVIWRPCQHTDWIQQSKSFVTTLGTFDLVQWQALHQAITPLVARLAERRGVSPPSDFHERSTFCERLLASSMLRLRHFPTTFPDLVAHVGLVQHLYLELTAILDWEEVYWPRFAGAVQSQGHQCDNNLLGSFTADPQLALMMHTACVPVWLLRTPDQITADIHIAKLCLFENPEECGVLTATILNFGGNSHVYPVIYRGSAGDAHIDVIGQGRLVHDPAGPRMSTPAHVTPDSIPTGVTAPLVQTTTRG